MRKWLFFTGAAVMAIAGFITYTLTASCSAPFVPTANAALSNCSPFLKYSFLLFSLAAAALFLAFIITSDHETQKHKK